MAWERHCFLPEQNPTKIDQGLACQTCKFRMFWLHNIPEKFAVSTRPLPVTMAFREIKCTFSLPHITHLLLIFFELSAKKSPYSDWSTHCSLMNLIGWLFCDVFGSKLWWAFHVSESRTKSFLNELYWTRHISDFVQVKSDVYRLPSPRPSMVKFLTELPLWTIIHVLSYILELLMKYYPYFTDAKWINQSERVLKTIYQSDHVPKRSREDTGKYFTGWR